VPVITLTTDFGMGSPYVAAMKGVILSLNPAATVVDMTHEVPPRDVRYGALVLEETSDRFPAGTIHVAVVDPGVGTARAIVFAHIGRQSYLAPDNGLLGRLAERTVPAKIVRLTEAEYWLQPVSATFHGRDILAPVAARLSLGLDPDHLGVSQDRLVMLDRPQVRVGPGRIEGSVLLVDGFGNLITDITAALLAEAGGETSGGEGPAGIRIWCRQRQILGLSRTYGDHPPGTPVALVGSSDRLEIAVVGASAAATLGAGAGDPVTVRWE